MTNKPYVSLKRHLMVKPSIKESNFEKIPVQNEIFFDQFKRIPAKIMEVTGKEIIVKFSGPTSTVRSFRFREIEWDSRAQWWIFKEEKKQYYVWIEIVSSENNSTRQGVWNKACNIPMTETTANTLEKLLKLENPQFDFAVSIDKPSSYFM